MYEIYNNVEGKTVFHGNEVQFIEFAKMIAIENEDFDFTLLNVSDAIEYICVYCDNLELL